MDPELEKRLHNASREDLIQLLEELSVRHPVLLTEIMSILERLPVESVSAEESDEEVTEDWDFNGDEKALPAFHNNPIFPPRNNETHLLRIEAFDRCLRQDES